MASVVGVDCVPPERLLYWDRIERAVEQPDAAARTKSETCGEQGLIIATRRVPATKAGSNWKLSTETWTRGSMPSSDSCRLTGASQTR